MRDMQGGYGAFGEETSFKNPPQKFSVVRLLSMGVVILAAAMGTTWVAQKAIGNLVGPSLLDDSTNAEAQIFLLVDNEITRRTSRSIGDGLYDFVHIAQVHKPSRLRLNNDTLATWECDGVLISDGAVSSLEFTFTEVRRYTIVAKLQMGESVEAHAFEVHVKIVRYEIRDLSLEDREAYFNALSVLYTMPQLIGEAKYGDNFKSAAWLVDAHLKGAADRECDHWHDDAGIMNHHIGLTWQLEQSLRMVNPTTAVHYWDYTRDVTESWYYSDVFQEDWFGSNSPSNDLHIIDTGRWAYTSVIKNSVIFSDIRNPYGLMRSPWNTNPVAYVMRHNRTVGVFADANSNYPACRAFALRMGESLGQVFNALNGELHGPVHIMIGGHWDIKPIWENVANETGYPDTFLLLSKFLWRQGFVRLPSFCSDDTPHAECMPYCPSKITENYSAEDLVSLAGVLALNPDDANITSDSSSFNSIMEKYGLDSKDLLEELCHIGSPGEMFTSAAPQDPIFWPLHGNAERFLQLLRILKKNGKITLNEKWDYDHMTHLPSDTGIVCDWSEVTTGSFEMPNCTQKTCPGHKADDLLPFGGLFKHQDSLYTNLEFYDLVSPGNEEMPYVYDSLDYWEQCVDQSMYKEYLKVDR